MKTKLLITLSFILSVGLQAQKLNIDSAWKALETAPRDTNKVLLMAELAFEYFYKDNGPKIADSLIREVYILSDELDYLKGESIGHHHMAVKHFIIEEDYFQAQRYFHKSMQIRRKLSEPVLLTQVYTNLASSFLMENKYDSALHYYFQSQPIIDKIKDEETRLESEGTLKLNFGLIYMWQENYEMAIESYEAAKKVNLKQGDWRGAAKAYNYIGLCLSHLGRYEEAFVSLDSSMAISLRHNYDANIYELYSNLGVVHDEAGNLEEGLKWHIKSEEVAIKKGDLAGSALNNSNIASSLFQMGRYRESLARAEKALSLQEHFDNDKLMSEIYGGISQAQYALGNYEAAWEATALQSAWKDSVQKTADAQLINEFETRLKSEEQRKEIVRLEEEQKLRDELDVLRAADERNKNNLLYGIIIVVAVIAIIVGWALFEKNKNNKKLTSQKKLIEEKHRDLEKANSEITLQKEEIEEKNKDIVSSITYAKRLQDALLPSKEKLTAAFPEVGLLYMPKDIVSGDFYWMHDLTSEHDQTAQKVLFAVADCTGHGVPGAMVSVVGHNGLERAVKEFGLSNPAEILQKLDALVTETFSSQNKGSTVRDGMDMSLCSLDLSKNALTYSGANNSLYVIRKKSEDDGAYSKDLEANAHFLFEIKPNKQPIGAYDNQSPFTSHEVALKKGDTVFLFTDGFADQFGGPKGKKFKYQPFKELLLSLQNLPLSEQMEQLNSAFMQWKGDIEQLDDVCLMGVRV